MKTKEKILQAALELFNEIGTDAASLRVIAQKVGISHGNLAYHFPNTDFILHQLYLNLVKALDKEIHGALEEAASLEALFRTGWLNFQILYQYRFLLLDFVRIMRRIEAIMAHFTTLTELRKQQFRSLLDALTEAELVIPEPVPGSYDRLIQRWLIMGDYWIPYSEVHFKGTEQDRINTYLLIFAGALEPFLTAKGLEQYLDQVAIYQPFNTPSPD